MDIAPLANTSPQPTESTGGASGQVNRSEKYAVPLSVNDILEHGAIQHGISQKAFELTIYQDSHK